MDVKKCDRCGAIYGRDYEKNARGSNFLLITDESISPVLFPQKVCFRLDGAPARPMDICPGCAESFKRWFGTVGRRRVTEE